MLHLGAAGAHDVLGQLPSCPFYANQHKSTVPLSGQLMGSGVAIVYDARANSVGWPHPPLPPRKTWRSAASFTGGRSPGV